MSAGPPTLPPARCFQGVIPAAIATCSRDGTPNVTYLSQVHQVGPHHVALSCQFFNKTKQNVLENPFAEVQLYDPVTFAAYRLSLRFERAETEGALFDAMAARIDVIASHTGMAGVFRLISADVYRVLECEPLHAFLLPEDEAAAPAPDPLPGPRSELRGLQRVSQVLCAARDLDALLEVVLETLEDALGFEHSMLLLPEGPAAEATDPPPASLRLVASHGYGRVRLGAAVELGVGVIGSAALRRRAVRISGMPEELRYGRAIRKRTQHESDGAELGPEVPLPGLPEAQSQMAIPLLSADRLVGVLAVESEDPLGFDSWDEAFLEIIAGQIAAALDSALLRGAAAGGAAQAGARGAVVGTAAPASDADSASTLRFQFFRNDDCVFVDRQYLIRNVPGRILWKLLRAHVADGRTEFNNRELRLDPWLALPAVRDNLESRLSLLRKRLRERCPEVQLLPVGRGHFRLETSRRLELVESDHA